MPLNKKGSRMKMITQKELFAKEKKVNKQQLSKIGFAIPFLRNNASSSLFIKVKPVNFLNNSNLLSDVFARGDCIICNLETGTIFVAKGTEEIKIWNAVILDKEIS